jgi:hypothetical protein
MPAPEPMTALCTRLDRVLTGAEADAQWQPTAIHAAGPPNGAPLADPLDERRRLAAGAASATNVEQDPADPDLHRVDAEAHMLGQAVRSKHVGWCPLPDSNRHALAGSGF